jgi:predicted small secreted protein
MVERIRRLAVRIRPMLFLALTLILAACNQNNGGGAGPGY